MNPQNRRISMPKLPPDVLDVGVECDPPFDDLAPTHEFAPPGRAPAEARAAARWVIALRAVAGGALVVAVSTGAAWAAKKHITQSPRFAVTDIEISGQKHRSAETLAAEAGIAKGQNVFALDLDRARGKVLADPWISEASLSRRLPGTVRMEVTEREAAAIVALGDSYLASRDGDIFKRMEPGDPSDLPVITGLTGDAVAEDRKGAERAVQHAIDLAGEYERGPLASRAPLEEVHLEGDGAVTLVVGKDALSLRMGQPPFRRKLEQAARILAELDRRGAKADAIMLDNDARPERAVARMR